MCVQAEVTHATLNGGVFCGYQGWFRAKGDGSALGWVHYGPGEKFAPRLILCQIGYIQMTFSLVSLW